MPTIAWCWGPRNPTCSAMLPKVHVAGWCAFQVAIYMLKKSQDTEKENLEMVHESDNDDPGIFVMLANEAKVHACLGLDTVSNTDAATRLEHENSLMLIIVCINRRNCWMLL